jgi:hypothetical protein
LQKQVNASLFSDAKTGEALITLPAPADSGHKSCLQKAKRPFTILFVTLSAVLALTFSVLYWNYYETMNRRTTKTHGVILDHWGKGKLSKNEREMIEKSVSENRKPNLVPTDWAHSYFEQSNHWVKEDDEKEKGKKVSLSKQEDYPEGFFRSDLPQEEKVRSWKKRQKLGSSINKHQVY